MRILLTGAAGFIGMHTAERLLARGETVLGLDNLNDYYDVSLKLARLERLQSKANFKFIQLDVKDSVAVGQAFAELRPNRVIHLAAQAGVRYSLEIRKPISMPTCMDSRTFSKAFDTTMSNTWSTPVARAYTAAIRPCLSLNTIILTIQSAFTRQQKKPTSSWRIPIVTCLGYPQRD